MNPRPLLLLLVLSACTHKADLVITGGNVWTGLSTGKGQPGAVAIAGGKILAVGDSAEVARYVGSRTKVLHAKGGLIMPGFADGHTGWNGPRIRPEQFMKWRLQGQRVSVPQCAFQSGFGESFAGHFA